MDEKNSAKVSTHEHYPTSVAEEQFNKHILPYLSTFYQASADRTAGS
jgi:hypothetical protein